MFYDVYNEREGKSGILGKIGIRYYFKYFFGIFMYNRVRLYIVIKE